MTAARPNRNKVNTPNSLHGHDSVCVRSLPVYRTGSATARKTARRHLQPGETANMRDKTDNAPSRSQPDTHQRGRDKVSRIPVKVEPTTEVIRKPS